MALKKEQKEEIDDERDGPMFKKRLVGSIIQRSTSYREIIWQQSMMAPFSETTRHRCRCMQTETRRETKREDLGFPSGYGRRIFFKVPTVRN